MNLDEKKKFIINFAYFALCTVIILLFSKIILTYLFPFFVGVFIAYAVQKPSKLLAQKFKIKKEICAAVLSVVIFVITIILIGVAGWFVYVGISKLFDYLSQNRDVLKKISDIINNLFKIDNGNYNKMLKDFFTNFLTNIVEKAATFISSRVTGFIKKLPSFLVSSVVTVVATCYISKDFEKVKKFLKGIISAERYQKAVELKSIFLNCISKFFIGYFWIFLITFLELTLGFFALGIKNSILLALVIALFDLLPILGTGTILLPWSIVSMLKKTYFTGVGLVLLYLIIVVVRNFLEPKIIGKQIEINPLFMLFFIFLGLKLGGIIGMLILPIVLTVLFTYYKRKYTV